MFSIFYIFFTTNNSTQCVVLFFVTHLISKESLCWFWWKKKKVFFPNSSDNLTKRNMWYFTVFSKYTTLEVLLYLKLDLQGSYYIKAFYYKKYLKLFCLHVLSCSVSELNCLSILFLSEASVDNIIFMSFSYDMSLLYLSAPLNTFIILIPCRDIKLGKCRYILMKYNQTTFFQ